jgi:hypothetical protein
MIHVTLSDKKLTVTGNMGTRSLQICYKTVQPLRAIGATIHIPVITPLHRFFGPSPFELTIDLPHSVSELDFSSVKGCGKGGTSCAGGPSAMTESHLELICQLIVANRPDGLVDTPAPAAAVGGGASPAK